MPEHRRKYAVNVPQQMMCLFTSRRGMNRHIYEETFTAVFTQVESHYERSMKICNPFTKLPAYKGNNDILFKLVDLAKK
jgi:hypothetical protein